MHALISFVGANPNYDEITYELKDKNIEFKARFIGVGLAKETKPDKLLLIGTSKSVWGKLFEYYKVRTIQEFNQEVDEVNEDY